MKTQKLQNTTSLAQDIATLKTLTTEINASREHMLQRAAAVIKHCDEALDRIEKEKPEPPTELKLIVEALQEEMLKLQSYLK